MKTNAADEQGLRAKAYKVIAKLKNRSVATALQLWQDAVADDGLGEGCVGTGGATPTTIVCALRERVVDRAVAGCTTHTTRHHTAAPQPLCTPTM